MRRQHQMTPLGLRRFHQRQHRHHHRKQPDRAHRHRDRRLHRGRPRPQRRDQDDLRRTRPDQERAAEHPAQAEMAVMGQRADAEIGRKQHQRQHGGCDRAHAPCERAQGALPLVRVESGGSATVTGCGLSCRGHRAGECSPRQASAAQGSYAVQQHVIAGDVSAAKQCAMPHQENPSGLLRCARNDDGTTPHPGTPLFFSTKHAPPALRMRLQRSSAAGRVSAPIRTW